MNAYPQFSAPQTLNGTRKCDRSVKMLVKVSIPCTAPVSSWLFMLYIIRAISDWICITAATSAASVFVSQCPKASARTCRWLSIFLHTNHFPREKKTLQDSRQFTTISMDKLHCFVTPTLTPTVNTQHRETNHHHSFSILLVRLNFYTTSFFILWTVISWNFRPRRWFHNGYKS